MQSWTMAAAFFLRLGKLRRRIPQIPGPYETRGETEETFLTSGEIQTRKMGDKETASRFDIDRQRIGSGRHALPWSFVFELDFRLAVC